MPRSQAGVFAFWDFIYGNTVTAYMPGLHQLVNEENADVVAFKQKEKKEERKIPRGRPTNDAKARRAQRKIEREMKKYRTDVRAIVARLRAENPQATSKEIVDLLYEEQRFDIEVEMYVLIQHGKENTKVAMLMRLKDEHEGRPASQAPKENNEDEKFLFDDTPKASDLEAQHGIDASPTVH